MSHNSIKKYAAFIFMFFTVLSGSSDSIDSDSIVKFGRKAIINIITTNKLMLQDIRITSGQLTNKSAEDKEGLREFPDTYAEDSHLGNIQTYIFPLIIFILCINYLLLQNNIWKNAVF